MIYCFGKQTNKKILLHSMPMQKHFDNFGQNKNQ
mgnify:CR=1 FL=1